jgi:hypothetical protein
MNMNNKDKNLNELLGKLLSAEEAAACRKDIARGDELLAANPVPAPRPELLADIRSQMLLAHHRKSRRHRMHVVYSSVSMAASLAVICGAAWFYVATTGSTGPSLAIEPASITPITENIQSVTAQLDQIEDTIAQVDSDSTTPAEYQADIANLESSLWKG